MEETKMAKTWTVREAYEAIKANDSSAIADFGKRFPLATAALARSGQNDGLNVLFSALPDRVTMRIIEMSLKDGVTPIEDGDEEDAPVEKPVKKEKAEKKQTAEKAEKPKKGGRPKKAEKPVEVEEDADAEDEAEETAQDYSKMGAVELFKLCKKRGIKVEPKQKANVYIKALEAADKADAEDEDDDWSDDAEDEKPAKKSAPAKGKAKATKKSDEDEDGEWDI